MAREWQSELQDDNCVHVIPLDDLQPRIPGADCNCGPDLELIDDSLHDLVIHHAYDKRELN